MSAMEQIALDSRSAGVLDAGDPGPASFDAAAFRTALGRFATGVAFITAAPGGEPTGLIVNSLAAVSLEPPLVSFCPARSSLTWSRMRRTGRFGVNVLARHHETFAVRATPPEADRFAGLDWEPGIGGVVTPVVSREGFVQRRGASDVTRPSSCLHGVSCSRSEA